MGSYISLPSYLNTVDQRYRLVGKKCEKCGTLFFPPRLVCTECGHQKMEKVHLSGKGTILTYTIIARGGSPTEFDDLQNMTGDYGVALVALDEGSQVIAQMTYCNPKDLKIGQKVKAVFRILYEQEGVVRYSYKFTPVP